jgi:hypothetical protein
MDETCVAGVGASLTTTFLGEFAIAKVALRCIETGVTVHRPLLECRYDLVLDDGGKLYRTQVKYTNRSSPKQCRGVVPVSLRKWRNGGRSVTPCYKATEIDLLLVYVVKLDKILWFGPEVFDGKQALHIRIEPTRNNQRKGCLLAADYVW